MSDTRVGAHGVRSAFGAGFIAATIALATACMGEILDTPEGPSSGPRGGAGAGAGSGGEEGPNGSAGSTACAAVGIDTGEGTLRRLSGLEYQLSLQDLFQLPAPPVTEGIPADTNKDGFTTFAALQTVSSQHLRGYLDVATRLANELLSDIPRRDRVIGCDLEAVDCLTSFVTHFGKLAFRRPLEAEELQAITTAATENALDTPDRFRYALEALLVSPSFLYRVEVGDAVEGVSTLTQHELASRLSFALWGRTPSEELLDEALAGALDTPEGLSEVATRMSEDERGRIFFGRFFEQWLGYEHLRAPKDPPPDWEDAWLGEMARETNAVLDAFAWGGADFLDVLTTNTTQLGPELALFYGVPPPGPDGRVTFAAGHPRANTGLLTHASLLSAKSDGDRISIRGNWLRKTFQCRNLEVPPELAEEFGELLVGLTRVEIVQKRNTEEGCKNCHALIDPIGISFEPFDDTGRFDASVDITPFGVTPGLPGSTDAVESVADLAALLRAMPEVSACLTQRVFLYAHGREPKRADACALESTTAAFAETGHDFRSLVRGLVEAPAFRLRRAEPARSLTP